MATIDNIVADLRKAIESAKSGKTQAYDTVATVKRVAGNTAWVQIPGGTSETPVQLTIACQPGDTVQVRVGGGRAWLTGNQSAPPTDDTTARSAQTRATEAQATADDAHEIASDARAIGNEAKRIAGDTNQYFWHTETGDDTGAHITEKTQGEFLEDPQNGGGNLLARSNGIAVRDGLTELATFGADGARVGKSDGAHSIIDDKGQRFYASDGTTQLANIGYEKGLSDSGDIILTPHYTFGTRKTTSTAYDSSSTYNIGDICVYNDEIYVCVYRIATPESWDASHWQYYIGGRSIAEGRDIIASSPCSHAEGYNTKAIGVYSHAQNLNTIATKYAQTVIGVYNEPDTATTTTHPSHTAQYGQYAFIIGNGLRYTARSNAFTVDWRGNVEAAGSIEAAGHITSAITACGNNSTDLSLTTSEQRIPMTTYIANVGSHLSVSDNGIRCGKTGFVEVSANIYFTSGFTKDDLVHLIIRKGTTDIMDFRHRLSGTYTFYGSAPIVYEVSAGDYLYLYAYNQTAARGKVSRSTLSWLTVKYL